MDEELKKMAKKLHDVYGEIVEFFSALYLGDFLASTSYNTERLYEGSLTPDKYIFRQRLAQRLLIEDMENLLKSFNDFKIFLETKNSRLEPVKDLRKLELYTEELSEYLKQQKEGMVLGRAPKLPKL